MKLWFSKLAYLIGLFIDEKGEQMTRFWCWLIGCMTTGSVDGVWCRRCEGFENKGDKLYHGPAWNRWQ